MSEENPYQPSEVASDGSGEDSAGVSSERAAYNVVSDTVVGLNVRKSDNKFQALFVLVSMLVGAAVLAFLAWLKPQWGMPWYAGAMVGALAGMVIGFFASGIYLMIYRAVRHAKGQHD